MYEKNIWKSIEYFDKEEFDCKCCGGNEIDIWFVYKLNSAREKAGIVFKINSGYRCKKHNKDVGSRPTSSHIKGLAADIRVGTSRERWIILNSLLEVGFTRIGIGSNFIHVDADKEKVNRVIWTY